MAQWHNGQSKPVNTCGPCGGGACILGSDTPTIPRMRSARAPQFWRFPIPYLCLHPLTQNDQIRHGNTRGGACFRTAVPLHLHKCVARFVSDSCVSCLIMSTTQFRSDIKQEFVRPRWPYDMRPSARAEKYMCVIVIR